MQKVLVNNVAPGAVIAKDIYSSDGILLISKGVSFREDFVSRFDEIGIKEIYIEEDGRMSEETILEIQKNLHIDDVIYENTRLQAQIQVKKTMVRFCAMGNINIDKISQLVQDIIEQLLAKKDLVFALSKLRSVDDYTYRHSVNVGVLSIIMGIDLKLDKNTLKELGIGAILHDIGKAVIPEEILKKPSKLTKEEFTEIKRHTDYGYALLRNTDLSEEAAQIALYHHEKFDGSGYNAKLKGKNIPLLSRIVAVADVYDAMSNDRVYKRKTSPDKVYKEISHLGDKHFDTDIMEKFIAHLNIYPTGIGIILNTNHKGIVIAQNKFYPESPIVRIFRENKTDIRNLYVDIDLSLTTHLYIMDTF